MANVKISGLPPVTSLASSDVIPVVASSATSKITLQNFSSTLTLVPSASRAVSSSYALTASYALNGGGGGGTPGGSSGQLQYNNASAFGGVATATYDGTTFRATGSFSGSFTGQLTGTASYVSGSVHGSTNPALSASYALSSSYALTSSFVVSASYALSSSYSLSSSFVTSASYASTSSYIVTAQTASYLNNLNQNLSITGSLTVSGSPNPEIIIIGETTITGSLRISGSSALTLVGSGSITSGSLAVGNISPSSTVGRIDASNDVVAFSTSDQRLKTNINPILNSINKVNSISGIEFDWIENIEVHGNSGHDVGVIAQEIEKVLPEIVTTRENGYKAVKYEKIVPLLIEAIKDLQKQIDELKTKI